MKMALTRAVSASIAECELTFIDRGKIDVARAQRQHSHYVAALEQLGYTVEVLPAENELPDAVFLEDALVVLNDFAVLLPMGGSQRRREVASVAPVVARHRETYSLQLPALMEGGDILRIGRDLYVGLGSRTTEEGMAQFRAIVEPRGYQVIPVEIGNCLHLKTGCTYTGRHLLINPDWIDGGPFRHLEQLPVPKREPWSANTIACGDKVLTSSSCPEMATLLGELGYDPLEVDVSEFEKAEAGVTCLSILFENG